MCKYHTELSVIMTVMMVHCREIIKSYLWSWLAAPTGDSLLTNKRQSQHINHRDDRRATVFLFGTKRQSSPPRRPGALLVCRVTSLGARLLCQVAVQIACSCFSANGALRARLRGNQRHEQEPHEGLGSFTQEEMTQILLNVTEEVNEFIHSIRTVFITTFYWIS